jgi:hypothetical protein
MNLENVVDLQQLLQPPRGVFSLQDLGKWVEQSFPQCTSCVVEVELTTSPDVRNAGGTTLEFFSWDCKPRTMRRDFDFFFPSGLMLREMQHRGVTRAVTGPLELSMFDACDERLARVKVGFVEVRKTNKKPVSFQACRFRVRLSGARFMSTDSDDDD